MTLDNNTILANLALALAEKEEEIKKLRLAAELDEQHRGGYHPTHRSDFKPIVSHLEAIRRGNNTPRRIVVGKTYEELEAELLAAKDQIAEFKESDVWYQRARSANRRRKKAERMLRRCRKQRDNYQWLYEHQSEIAEEIQSKRTAAESEAERCQRRLDNITDNIDCFMRERLALMRERNALLIVSQQTQLNEKNKLIEEKDKLIAQLTQQLADLNAQQNNH